MAHELLGQTLGGRYTFEEQLGEGTFATVFRITDQRRRATLAAKVLRPDFAQDPDLLERFKREAEVLSRLQHPHIVRFYDIVELEGYVFILTDYIPGHTLAAILDRMPEPFKPSASLDYLTPLCAALHFAHHEGIIHRDLKPANILIHENGTLYVTDFGIARMLNAISTLTQHITVGTPFYMSPEQITGQPVTAATDIYALGILLYEMYTKRLPFRGTTPGANGETLTTRIAYEQVHVAPEPPTIANPRLNPAVEDVIMRCLEKRPARRYASVAAFYDALTEAIGAPPLSLDTPLDAPQKEPSSPPTGIKIPEWSQFMTPVPDEPTPDAVPNAASQDEEPYPPTQPHLDRVPDQPATLVSHGAPPPTVPAMGHVIHDEPETLRHFSAPAPVASFSAQPDYRSARHLRGRAGLWLVSGVLGIVIVLCLAGAAYVLNRISGGEDGDSAPPANSADGFEGESAAGQGAERIAFSSQRSGESDIYIINADGTSLARIASEPGMVERGPSWSPDGTQIAFYAAPRGEGDYDLYVINVDGSGLRNLTNSPDVDERYPTWSPDGTRIAFHGNADGDYDLYVINADGGDPRPLTENDANDFGPDWSPDGTLIVFHTDLWGPGYELALVNVETGEIRRLTDAEESSTFATWSPDGTQLAYNVISSGLTNIAVMNVEAGSIIPLTDDDAQNSFPDWSADGSMIVFQRGQSSDATIYAVPINGGEPVAITDSQGDFLPEWEPAP